MDSGPVPEEEGEFGQTTRGVVGGTKLFDRFTLQQVIGRGGMGIVWLALDERLDRLVALKLVPEAVCFDASAHEDLKRETRKSLLLTHANIVRIFDFIEDGQTAAISMEYVDGSTLSSLRVKRPAKCFEVSEISQWAEALCDALSYAHGTAAVIHRDLKPANLMVNSRNELKVTDFGIACTLRDSMSRVSVRPSSGTLNYMSPQQLLGEDPSPADDIYAMGATLYELLSSKPPFYSGDVASQVRDVIVPTIAQRRAKFGIRGESIPRHWEETLARCLAKDPEQRPRTAADVARCLRLRGPVRLTREKGRPILSVDTRIIALATAVVALVVALSLSLNHPPSVPLAVTRAVPATGYALEKPRSSPHASVAPVSSAQLGQPPAKVESAPAPVIKASPKNATLQLKTTPTGATFAVYPGLIAGKIAPAAVPLRTGSTPGTAEDLPPGHYTLFFHNEGWPSDRAEITVSAGENVPVDYTFPHGSATIVSNPPGAEIFFGSQPLGQAPVTVDLPLGKQKLVAHHPDFSDKSQAVTIATSAEASVVFQMRLQSKTGSRVRPTPTPNAVDKIGQSLKHLFGGKPATPHSQQ